MRSSFLLAIIIAIGLGVWLYTGTLTVGGQGDDFEPLADQASAGGEDEKAIAVRVAELTPRLRSAVLDLRGRTEAEDSVEVMAETSGAVLELAVQKGDRVNPGDLICRIDPRTRSARLAEAQARLAKAQLDVTAQERLSENGFAPETRVRAVRAERDAALAAVEAAQWELNQTKIVAPIGGIIEDLPVRRGSLLSVGDLCATIVNTDPILAVAQVAERDVGKLLLGMDAMVEPVTGGTFTGQISYIAPAANAQTRTFRVDIRVPNPDGKMRAGTTAAIDVPLGEAPAHLIRPSSIVLNDAGELGLRTLNAENRVAFAPIQVIAESRDGIWVMGLPDKVTIITVGQEYVTTGALVAPERDETYLSDVPRKPGASEGVLSQ